MLGPSRTVLILASVVQRLSQVLNTAASTREGTRRFNLPKFRWIRCEIVFRGPRSSQRLVRCLILSTGSNPLRASSF